MSLRPITETRHAQPTMEGAGVHLHRAFGFRTPVNWTRFYCLMISETNAQRIFARVPMASPSRH